MSVAEGELELSRKCFGGDIKIAEERSPKDVSWYKAHNAWWMGLLALREGKMDQAKDRLSEMRSHLPLVDKDNQKSIISLHDLLQSEAFLAQGALDETLPISQKAAGRAEGRLIRKPTGGYGANASILRGQVNRDA